MPHETKYAIEWAMRQEMGGMKVLDNGKVDTFLLTHFVREYFNNNNIEYRSFSYSDLIPFLE